VLTAMLFQRRADGLPQYTADEALAFVAGSVSGGKGCWGGCCSSCSRVGGRAEQSARVPPARRADCVRA